MTLMHGHQALLWLPRVPLMHEQYYVLVCLCPLSVPVVEPISFMRWNNTSS